MMGIVCGVVLLLVSVTSCVNVLTDPAPQSEVPGASQTAIIYYVSIDSVLETAQQLIVSFENMVQRAVLDDIVGTLKTVLGKISYEFVDIAISNFDIGDLQINTDPGNNALYMFIENCTFAMNFSYTLSELGFPYKEESGMGTISTYNMKVNAIFRVIRVPDTGGIQLITDSVEFDIGEFNIEIDGGTFGQIVSSLEDIFADIINTTIIGIFNKFLNETIYQYIDYINSGLYKCYVDVACIDYRLTQDPKIVETGVYVYLSGVLYNQNHQDQMPTVAFTDQPQIATMHTFQVQLDNAIFQSLLDSLHVSKYFSLWNSKSNALDPTILPYEDIITYYPQWAAAYPEGTEGLLSLTVQDFPTSEIMYTGLRITIEGYVVLTPRNIEDATNIFSDVEIVLFGDFYWSQYHNNKTVEIVNDNEHFTIEAFLTSFSFKNSTVSKSWLQNIINGIYLTQINKNFENNPIYIYSYSPYPYIHPSINFYSDYVLIEADFGIDN